jgi:hypothetical protein
MVLWKRSSPQADGISHANGEDKGNASNYTEDENARAASSGFKLNRAGDGDEALNLFSSTADVHEPIDPLEEKKVVRKIDFMILPVCYSFLL